jgi:hypothetical protein
VARRIDVRAVVHQDGQDRIHRAAIDREIAAERQALGLQRFLLRLTDGGKDGDP